MKELIPKDKGDIEVAEKLKSYSYQDLKPIIPELLTWIQDLHWPVSGVVGDFLETISENLVKEIIEILEGDDDVWKFNCLVVFGIRSEKSIDDGMMIHIERIAMNPTKGEIEEGVQDMAKQLINEKKAIQ